MSSLGFCFSEEAFPPLVFRKTVLLGMEFWLNSFFTVSLLKMPLHCLICMVSDEKSYPYYSVDKASFFLWMSLRFYIYIWFLEV